MKPLQRKWTISGAPRRDEVRLDAHSHVAASARANSLASPASTVTQDSPLFMLYIGREPSSV